jgi:hypothetical protein
MSCNRINSRRRKRRNDPLTSYEANTMILYRLSYDLFDHRPQMRGTVGRRRSKMFRARSIASDAAPSILRQSRCPRQIAANAVANNGEQSFAIFGRDDDTDVWAMP